MANMLLPLPLHSDSHADASAEISSLGQPMLVEENSRILNSDATTFVSSPVSVFNEEQILTLDFEGLLNFMKLHQQAIESKFKDPGNLLFPLLSPDSFRKIEPKEFNQVYARPGRMGYDDWIKTVVESGISAEFNKNIPRFWDTGIIQWELQQEIPNERSDTYLRVIEDSHHRNYPIPLRCLKEYIKRKFKESLNTQTLLVLARRQILKWIQKESSRYYRRYYLSNNKNYTLFQLPNLVLEDKI
ncbi:hypothetical protein K469DRAFT_688165 [Zopfia rhizophila CBS 207.26]|uniref:Uncharacterized protein n=1 Tax=Zopfia rhizophila CBS 207.26 TaxID=1314779 RepID=A0A6A6E3R4_9PEZI|nr:hypothetical protein K469DRAFT_688165 [Zopfia rhizophila CBS 207.26]